MTYLTPKEACEQSCPLITYCVNPIQVQNDNQSAMHDHIMCMGPACKIGWRWGPVAKLPADMRISELANALSLDTAAALARASIVFVGQLQRLSDDSIAALGWSDAVAKEARAAVTLSPTHGYCGHFGRPE